MDSIKKAITDNLERSPEISVSVNLGELRELTMIIRDQSLNLEKELGEIFKSYPMIDVVDARQTEFRLKELFKQLTGIKVDNY